MKKQWSAVGKLGKSILLLVSVCFLCLLVVLIYFLHRSTVHFQTVCSNGTTAVPSSNNTGWLRAYRTYACTSKLQQEEAAGRPAELEIPLEGGQNGDANVLYPHKWSAQPCPSPFDHIYCFNGGKCMAEFQDNSLTQFLPFCQCALNYHGRRCEYLFNPELYGFSVGQNEVETAALSTLVTFLVLGICALCCCLYLYRRYAKKRESELVLLPSFAKSTASTTSSLSARQIKRQQYDGVCSL